MDRTQARTTLAGMVSASTPPVLSDADLNAALDAARVVDSEGRAPVDTGYVETFDLNYAAAEALDMRADQMVLTDTGGLTSFTADGASFTKRQGTTADGLRALAARYRSRSAAGATGGIGLIELAPVGRTVPRSWHDGVTTNAD